MSAHRRFVLGGLVKFISGNLSRKAFLCVLLPLIWLSYFGTLAIAAWLSPDAYNWRHKAISRLLYPRNDPMLHSVASLGIASAGSLMIPFAGYMNRRLRGVSPFGAAAGSAAFALGALFLVLAGLIVSHPDRGTSAFPWLHEMLARGAAAAIGAGMLVLWACALKAYSTASVTNTSQWFWLLSSWSLLTLPAILIILLRLAAEARFAWSNRVYLAIENPRVWHLGFWEWIGSAAVFVFLLSAALFLPRFASEADSRAPLQSPHGAPRDRRPA